jgi:hypothetical protein
MGKVPHKTTSQRRLITVTEWSYLLGMSRLKVYKLLEQYRKTGGNYEPRDIYSVLTFYRYILLSSPLLKAF